MFKRVGIMRGIMGFMKITDVIRKLQDILNKHGDLKVLIYIETQGGYLELDQLQDIVDNDALILGEI